MNKGGKGGREGEGRGGEERKGKVQGSKGEYRYEVRNGKSGLPGHCSSEPRKDGASRQISVLSTTGHGTTDELIAADTAMIYAPCTKACTSLTDWINVAKVNPNPFYPWIPSLFCTLPIDEPLKKVRLFCSRDFSRAPYHRSSARKGANLQLRSLLVLLFPPDACPNIFLFKTSAAPSGRAWLLYCEYLVESASGYRRAFFFL